MTVLITEKLRDGVLSGVFPGAVLLISHHEKIVYHKAIGHAQIVPTKIPLTLNTFFDLASLTKPLATATAIALLIGKRLLHLNDPVSKFIPEFKKGDKQNVTVAQLLNHSSGLPAWKPYYKKIARQDDNAKLMGYRLANREPLIALPGMQSLYSDIGFMLLGQMIEKVSEMRLDQFCDREIFQKLRCKNVFFPTTPVGRVASTEDCDWRGGVIRGVVHDDNAYAMGGMMGHAGLFGTAKGVYTLVQSWVASMRGEGLIDQKIANRFVRRQKGRIIPKGSTWGLGWDTPSVEGSSAGHAFSQKSFGHLGFTGTSIWVDRGKELAVILLTNRVHPSRDNVQIKLFRPALHDLIVDCIMDPEIKTMENRYQTGQRLSYMETTQGV